MKLVDRRVFIDALPEDVYELLTDARLLVEWMAPIARVEPWSGGTGAFVELIPGRRIVFTYGWDRVDVGIPPGSTTVEIDLRPRDGGTDLHLVHRGLTAQMADAHTGGWANYLARLTAVAEGREPGPDPLACERVPSASRSTPA